MNPRDARWNALEARYDELRHARMLTVACMAHESHNGSRAAMVRPTNLPMVETVNATEVRASERWTLDRPSVVKWPTKWDGTCYSIAPDGTRHAFTVATDTTDDRKSTPKAISATDARNARQRAIAGTIRMGEQD
jgi:hypothetical protein